MYIKTFANKLSKTFTRILVLVLAFSMLIPVELLNTFDTSEDGTAITEAEYAGSSGKIGIGYPGNAGVKSFHSGFKLGVEFYSKDSYVSVSDPEWSMDNFENRNGVIPMITSSIWIVPSVSTGGSPYWQNKQWHAAYYASGEQALIAFKLNKNYLSFTRGFNSQKSGKTGGIFYSQIKDKLTNDYDNFVNNEGWRTDIWNAMQRRNECLDNWEYILGWDSSETYHVNERYSECFDGITYTYDNYVELSKSDDKVIDYTARYLDMLFQLYAISLPETAAHENFIKAVDHILSGEVKDDPFAVVISPAITLVGVSGLASDIVITDTTSFIQCYFGISSPNNIMDWPVHKEIKENNDLILNTYGQFEYFVTRDLKTEPKKARISNKNYADENDAFSWGISGFTPGRMTTSGGSFHVTWKSQATARAQEHLWLNNDVDQGTVNDSSTFTYGVLYGVNLIPFMDATLDRASIGKIEALPDDAIVNSKQNNGKLGQNVDLKIHANVVTEGSLQSWDNILTKAKEDATFSNFELSIKVTRQCDYASWNTTPTYLDTTYSTGEINKTFSIEELQQFIMGNMDISENVDLISNYEVPEVTSDTTITFTYTMDLKLKATINGKEKIWKPASKADEVDTASFIIPEFQPDRLRYVSTQEAYAELKNYGPGSNQTGTLVEEYEVMSGVPTTEQLYYAAGGSEFIVDVSFEYCKDNKAIRSYTSYLSGVPCEFHGVGKDGMTMMNTNTYTKSGSVSGDIGGSWKVNTTNTNIGCNCDVCFAGGSCGNGGDWIVTIYAEYKNECSLPSCASGEHEYIVNGSSAFTEMNAAISEIKAGMDADASAWTYTASSDGVTRQGKGFSWTSGPPYSSPNGDPGSTDCTGGHSGCPGHESGDPPTISYCSASNCSKGSQGGGSITITGTWTPHYICGPCCSHHLPDIYDTWSQSWTYDSLKIIDAHVWRIDQAAASDLSEVIGPAVNNEVSLTPGIVAGTKGAYENPYGTDDGRVGASIKTNPPNMFYNIAMKNSNDLAGHDKNTTYLTQDGIGKATESSVVGRIRYSLDPTQHDMVNYELGARTNTCDGMAKTRSDNSSPAGGAGHGEKWGYGFIYSAFAGTPTHHGHNSNSVRQSDTQSSAVRGGNLNNQSTSYWHALSNSGRWNVAGQTNYPLDDVYYLQEHCDGNDGSSIDINGGSANTSANNGRLDVNTPEYAKLLAKRNQPVQATMITDFLILQTTSGDQSLLYYDIKSDTTGIYQKGTNTQLPLYNEKGERIPANGISKGITAETQIPTIEITQETLWDKNPKSSAKWLPDHINVGGYNGGYTNPSTKFKGTGHNEKVTTMFDNGDPAGVIVRTTRPVKRLMLYSEPLNIITEIENKSYLTAGMESEVFWANNLHWSDNTAQAMSINMNPIGADYSTTDRVGDTDNFDFFNFKDLVTTWGQDNNNTMHSYTGIIDDTKYSKTHDIELNGLIIQDPISTSEAALISLPDERDQRYSKIIDASWGNQLINDQFCPGTAEGCEFAVLNCKYGDDIILAEYYFNNNDGVNSVTLNSFGNPPSGWSFSNGKLIASGNASRIAIPLTSEFGLDYQGSTRLRVKADITLNSLPSYTNAAAGGALKTRISQMLFGYAGYGLYVSTEGKIGFINTDGQYRESTNMTLTTGVEYSIEAIMPMGSMDSCELIVNGTPITFTNSSTTKVKFNSATIGSYFNIGSMGATSYGPRATYDNIVIAKSSGTYNHTEDCYITQMIHPSGMNAHVHNANCLAGGTTTTVVEMKPAQTNTTVFNNTSPGQSTITLQPGIYKFETWGAQGGACNGWGSGGYGAYAVGAYVVTKATTATIYTGGMGGTGIMDSTGGVGGYNGGGSNSNGHGGGGGGKSNINIGSTTVIAAGGGGGGSHNSGNGRAGLGNNQAFGSGGGAGQCSSIGAGGNSYYGGVRTAFGITATATSGQKSGNGQVRITQVWSFPEGYNPETGIREVTTTTGTSYSKTFNYTGGTQSVTLSSGSYKLEVWGASGGLNGGSGGYSYGDITINSATTLYVVVGGQGGNSAGGYNGGGTSGGNQGGGGGATHIATVNGVLSGLSGYTGSIKLVAGGGGGGASGTGGVGGGTTGGRGSTDSSGNGGSQYSGGSGGNHGTFGQGGSISPDAGGGGGYYGGGSGVATGPMQAGGGGSGYVGSGVTGATTTSGYYGNGYAKITGKSVTTKTWVADTQYKTIVVKDGYDKYKEMYEKGQLTVADLKELFGDAYETLFATSTSYSKLSNFTTLSGFSNFVNCDLRTYSGSLIESITGTAPSFILTKTVDANQVYKIQMVISNNTSAKSAKIYWSSNGTFTEANSYTTVMEPNKVNQTINFPVGTKQGWRGTVNQFKICIPAEKDKNYGNTISIASIDFQYKDPGTTDFSYKTSAQGYKATVSGYYLLEAWGASGGNPGTAASQGGLGGYTKSVAKLNAGQQLYIYTGGQGVYSGSIGAGGGYNGGGHGGPGGYGGGGMTHITTSSSDSIRGSVSQTTSSTTLYSAGTVIANVSAGSTSVTLKPGTYKFEVYGAQGGGQGGLGGYSYGTITINSDTTAYLYAGGTGGLKSGGYNGGGTTNTSGYGGGGASDIRLNSTSLANRVIVAGGGGGQGPAKGGYGGGGNNSGGVGSGGCGGPGQGGTLSSGGAGGGARNGIAECGNAGSLGVGGNAWCINWNPTNHGGGGGGGGYYGGGAGTHDDYYYRQDNDDSGGGGGSGFVNTSRFTSYGGTNGANSGNGTAKITAVTDIKTTTITTTTTPSISFNPVNAYIIAGGGGGGDSNSDSAAGRGGAGGGTNAGNAMINGSFVSGSASGSNTSSSSANGGTGLGGTQNGGYRQGLGESATYSVDTGGAGGGYWGGLVTNNGNGGAGGGSGYMNTSKTINSYTATNSNGSKTTYTATTSNGANSGNGRARITFLEAAPGNWPTVEQILEVIDKIPENSDLFICNHEVNSHVCDEMCREAQVLKCSEPHHSGNHYAGSDLCYDACNDDAKHKLTQTISTSNGSYTPGNFINIDWGFKIYYNNFGDFYQSNTHGIGNLTNTRGIGYENDMRTSTWTRVKQVKFQVNTIYQGNLYRAGEWIVLSDKGDYLGVDGSPYDERNWSHYGTQLYNDLEGNLIDGVRDHLYEFYCVENNHEQAVSDVEVRAFAVNNTKYQSDCGDKNGFPTYVTNRLRQTKKYTSKHSAYNFFTIDVVGRIGNLAIIDTGDYRFSNLFKTTVASDVDLEEPTVYTAANEEIEPNENAEFNGESIITNGAGGGAVLKDIELKAGAYRIYVSGDNLISSGLSIKAHSTWETATTVTASEGINITIEEYTEEVEYDPGFANRTRTIVDGPGISLKAGENTIQMRGDGLMSPTWTLTADGVDLTPYITSTTITSTVATWVVNLPNAVNGFEVKTVYEGDTNISIEVLEVYRVNTDKIKEMASSDRITNLAASDKLRSYYIILDVDTIADISSISRGIPITVDSIAIQYVAAQDENWTVEGIVRNVDESSQNAYLTWVNDIRGLPIGPETQYIDTYSTIGWAQTATCMKTIPLDANQNNVAVLRDEALLVGYDIYASIGTLGDYYTDGGGFLQVIPEYYGVDVNTGEFFPVDAYIYYDNSYYPINIWGLVTGEDHLTWGDGGSGYDIKSIYNFVTLLKWNQEKARRMVTSAEVYQTEFLKDYLKVPINEAGTIFDYLDVPSGNSYIMGNAQFLQLNGKARTFVGGETTYGGIMNYTRGDRIREDRFKDAESGYLYTYGSGLAASSTVTDEAGITYNETGILGASEWWRVAQRWHLTLGLASSSVFVRAGLEPTTENIAEIQSKNYVVLSTVDIRVLGSIWNLIYEQENGAITVTDANEIQRTYDIPEKIIINGQEHVIPPAITVYQTVKSSPFDIDIISNH